MIQNMNYARNKVSMKHTMVRCGITTLKSFKQAIQDLPDDYLIGTDEFRVY